MNVRFFGLVVALLLLFGQAHSDVVILAEQRSSVLDKLAKNLSTKIADRVVHKVFADLNKVGDAESAKAVLSDDDIVILAGEAAVRQWQGSQTSIAIWAGRTVIEERAGNISSAIYSEPPLTRQLALARYLFPDARISSIFSEQAPDWLVNELKEAQKSLDSEEGAKNGSFDLVLQRNNQSLNYALREALSGHDVLLGVADSEVYNPSTVKNILISAYRQNIPLIGPHRAYIRAGAIATTYSTLDHTTQRLAELIIAPLIPSPSYNPYFTVVFNEQVARSLNILLPVSADAVAQAIR